MQFVIHGGKKLSGALTVSGSKNASLPIIAATILTDQECVIDNVPRISDVETMLNILRSLGGSAQWTGDHQVTMCMRDIALQPLDQKLIKNLRASLLITGPLLARFSEVPLSEPGGCIIGNRPLNAHIDGLSKLGVVCEEANGQYYLTHNGLTGARVPLLEKSVTATENVMMAATRATGQTTILNAACEPHVCDLANFLRTMGATIEGEGTSTIHITGVSQLSGARHAIIPDDIEAGTFIIMALVTRSVLTVQGVRLDHLDIVLEKLASMGARFDIKDDSLTILQSGIMKATKIDTRPYPGLATDLQPVFGILATQAHGTTLIHDTMFEGRLGYVQELIKMGANAVISDPHRAFITGPTQLHGQVFRSPDLRAGITMILAGLIASGETVINDAHVIDRGYEHIEKRLAALGADIVRQAY